MVIINVPIIYCFAHTKKEPNNWCLSLKCDISKNVLKRAMATAYFVMTVTKKITSNKKPCELFPTNKFQNVKELVNKIAHSV